MRGIVNSALTCFYTSWYHANYTACLVTTDVHSDSQLIDDLGGPAAVCALLGYDKAKGGLQRVHNWRVRGIPPKVKLERPDVFLRLRSEDKTAGAQEVQRAA